MSLFQRKRAAPALPVPQLRRAQHHPFPLFNGYVPLSNGDERLYRAIREAVPIVDAAIVKIIRLTGGFTVSCSNPNAQRGLENFLRTVNTGRGQRGFNSFLDAYLDSMLTSGRAVGEIVTRGDRDIEAVLCGRPADVSIREGSSPLDFTLCDASSPQNTPFPYQHLLLFTPYNPEADSPYGTSMLRSMPFLTDILLKIYHSLGMNWERAGNVRFAVTYKPQNDAFDRACARERGELIAREWSEAMRQSRSGVVRDFVAVGDVDVKVIGADGQVLDSEIPVRQILEQLIARTGIPPFMLGLTWSSTERMSAQQADLMTSELTALRRTLTPVCERVCDLWLRMHGFSCPFSVVWDEINLQDNVEDARARLYDAQAQNLLHSSEREVL